MKRISIRSFAVSAITAALFFCSSGHRAGATDIITTLAGGGSVEGYAPDEANLFIYSSPGQGLAISSRGEIYLSDTAHHQVVKLNPLIAQILIVAGNGAQGYSGDGLPAAAAALNSPGALAFDATGNLFIADCGNFAVRRVDATSGVITTIAGTGLFTGQVVGTNPPAPLGDGGLPVNATFGNMGGLALDGSNGLIVCDSGNACVRRVNLNPGGTISTIMGTPGSSGFLGDGAVGGALSAKFNVPVGLAIDATGILFVADSGNRRIRRLSADGTVTTVVGSGTGGNTGFTGDGGAPLTAQIGSLGGIAFNSAGELIITCVGANRIRKVNVAAVSPFITTIAGNSGGDVLGDGGPATGAVLSGPRDVAVDAQGNVFVHDGAHRRIRRIDQATGFIDTIIGSGLIGFIGDRGPKQGSVLSEPAGAAYDAAGNLYIVDVGDTAIRKVSPNGTITTFAGSGAPLGLGDGGPSELASLGGPEDVCVVGSTLFIADTGNNRVRAVDLATGLIRTYASVSSPVAVIANPAGVLFVAHDDQVDTVDLVGNVAPFAGDNPIDTVNNPLGDGLPATNATLSQPRGLALTAVGELLIADSGNNRIRKIPAFAGATVSTVAGGGSPVFPSIGDGGAATSASLNAPGGVAVDANRIVIADTGNHRIRVVSGGGITTICGTGVAGIAGDGDISSTAAVNSPGHIFFRGANLVIADAGNNRIRQIVPAIDIDPRLLSLSARLNFTTDKKTGELLRGKDTMAVKAGLALPAGISAANLTIQVDVVDIHQQTQFDAAGKPPRVVKPATAVVTPFGFTLPAPPLPLASKYAFALKGTSVAGGRPTAFAFNTVGTLREELGRAGYSNVSTPKTGTVLPARVNITLGTVTFTGVASTNYKALQGKSGAAVTVK